MVLALNGHRSQGCRARLRDDRVTRAGNSNPASRMSCGQDSEAASWVTAVQGTRILSALCLCCRRGFLYIELVELDVAKTYVHVHNNSQCLEDTMSHSQCLEHTMSNSQWMCVHQRTRMKPQILDYLHVGSTWSFWSYCSTVILRGYTCYQNTSTQQYRAASRRAYHRPLSTIS